MEHVCGDYILLGTGVGRAAAETVLPVCMCPAAAALLVCCQLCTMPLTAATMSEHTWRKVMMCVLLLPPAVLSLTPVPVRD